MFLFAINLFIEATNLLWLLIGFLRLTWANRVAATQEVGHVHVSCTLIAFFD